MYIINYNGQNIGPMTAEQVVTYDVTPETNVSKDNAPWQPLSSFPELLNLLNAKDNARPNWDLVQKKTICGVLAIILPWIGLQYFLIGKTQAGIITIVLSIVTCGAWDLIVFIQGILMLTMDDEKFYQKYIASTSTLPLF